MGLALLTLEQVTELFLMILAGYVCVRTGAVKMEGKKFFSDLMMSLTVPAMMLHSYMMGFDEKILANIVSVLGWSVLVFILAFALTFLITGRMKGKDMPMVRCACVFSNADRKSVV